MDKQAPRILIVDDDPNMLGTVGDILKIKGFEPFRALTGSDALAQLQANHMDVALIDLRLGEISGLDVMRDIKSHSPETECILLTGHATQNSAIEAIQMGAFGYFQKPFDIEQVLLSIQRAVEKHDAKEALKESEARLHALIKNAADLIVVIDPEGVILYASPSSERILGYTDQEFLGKKFHELVHPEDLPVAIESLASRREIAGTAGDSIEVRSLHKNGTWRVIEVLGTNLLAEPAVKGIVMNVRDVTERKYAEEKLRRSEERFRDLIEHSADAITLLDANGIVLYESPTAKHLLEHQTEERVGVSIFELLEEEDLTSNKKLFGKILQQPNVPVDAMFRYLHDDGTHHWAEATLTNLLNEPSVNAIVVNYRDITERKLAEEALHKSEQRYRGLFEDSPIAIWEEDFSEVKKYLDSLKQQGIVDFRKHFEGHPDAVFECGARIKITSVNNAAVKMYAAESKDVLIKSTNQILSKGEQEHIHEDFIAIAEGRIGNSWEGPDETLSGESIEISLSWSVAPGYEDDFSKVIVTTLDITERKLAEDALRKNEERYRLLFDSSPVGIFSATPQGQIVEINPVALQILGSPSVEATKAINLLTFPRLVETGFSANFQGCVESGRAVFSEQSYTSKWGKSVYAQYRLTPIPDISGQVSLIQVILEDITERKQAEEALRKSEERFKTVFEQSPLGISLVDSLTGHIYAINPRFAEIAGRSMEEMANIDWMQITHPDDLQTDQDNMALLIAGKINGFQMEKRYLHPDGKAVWINMTIAPLSIEGKAHPRHLCMIEDITERRRAEEQLRLQDSALNAVASSIFITDIDGIIKWVNPAYSKLSGYALEEAVEKNPRDLVKSGEHDSVFYKNMWDTILSGQVWQGELVNRRKDGSHYTEELTITPLKDMNGRISHFIAIEQDISGRKQVEKALREREEQYRTLVEQLPAIVFIDDANDEGRTLYVSPQIKTILGFTPQEWQEESPGLWSKQVHPDDNERVHAKYMRCFQHGEPYDAEYRIRASDGRQLWFHDQAIMLRNENGLPHLIHGVMYDITERKQAEESLRESEKRYHDLFEDSPIALVEEDFSAVKQWLDTLRKEGVTDFHAYLAIHPEVVSECAKMVKVKDVNKAALKMYRADSKNKMPKDLSEILDTNALGNFIDQLASIAEGQVKFNWEGINHAIDDSQMDVEVNWSAAAGYEKDLSKVIVSLQDITERKLANEAIHQRVVELGLLYESGLAFSQLLNPKEIAQKIIKLLEQKMNWHHTAIRLYDPETKTLRLLAFNQPTLSSVEEITAAEEQLKARVKRFDQGLSGWVIQHGQTVRSNDLANDKRYVESLSGMQSGLYVPMKLGERVIGVVSIESAQPNAFSEADEHLTGTLANQAASALENARLFDETSQRIIELTALHRTGQILLAARLNSEQIYAAVHQAVAQTMPCEAFVIVLDDEERGEYHAVYFFDKGQRFPARWLPRGKGLSGRVISSGETLLIDDATAENAENMEATHFGSKESTRSILAVPLRRGSEIVGMLSTQSYQPRAFGESQQVMLETITAQLASALDNANLYQQTQERIKELETLHIISTSLRTIKYTDEALSILLDKTLATLETDSGSILLYDPPSNELRHIVARGWFTKLAAIPVKAGRGVAGTVFASGEPYYSVEFFSDALVTASSRERIPAGWGGICLPIQTSTETFGVLFVSTQQPRQINSQQIRLLESLVDMAGAALHRMRLHNETARRAEEFASLYETSKVLSAEYDLNSLLKVIVDHTKIMLNASTSGMYLYHAESQELELTMDTLPTIPIGSRMPLGEGVAGKVAQTRQPMRIDDYSTWEGRSPKFENTPIHAVIEVPMLYAGELIGVLTADETSESGRKFTEADERLLSLFASQAAGAINSARHREDTTHYAEELEQRVVERTAEIETTRQRLDLAASAGGIGVWEINLKDNTVFWDTRMHMIHGTGITDFDNSLDTWWKMFHPEDVMRSQKQFENALQKTGLFLDEYRILLPDASIRHIAANAVVLYNADHQPERMIGVNMDITDRKRTEEAMAHANFEMERALRTKDEFLANMSHELRTPLNSILGISESLEEQFVGALNEKQLKYTGIIRESGRHLLELINDILDISKIEAGRMELELQNLSVDKICQSSLRMIKELAQKKNLRVLFEIKGNVKTLLGDERRMKQSLVNLLGNAVKFTPQGGAIGLEVNGHADLNEITFTVWDKGVGIADEDIQYLFKPFVQLDAGLSREYQGTGLGLALVAQMIRLHGGRVHVESELGQGSRFIITLPWLREQQIAQTKMTAELPRLSLKTGKRRSGKILLVEDTDVVITLMSEYLHYKGYQVLTARNGFEGVQLAKDELPDLILMDVMMPVMDGLEATKQIRKDPSLKNVPIIALTALAMSGDRELCLAAGMNDYMSKPIKMQELSDMIEKYLSNGEQTVHAR